MKESDVMRVTGLSVNKISVYRHHCGLGKAEKGDEGKEWGEVELEKLAGYLGLEKGVFKVVEKEIEEEVEKNPECVLVVCRIYPNPSIVGVRSVDGVMDIDRKSVV